MPPAKYLEPSLYNCNHNWLLGLVEHLVKLLSRSSTDKTRQEEAREIVKNIIADIDGWMAMGKHQIPLYQDWYRHFADSTVEGLAGETCPKKIWLKGRFTPRPNQVDLDQPETWKENQPELGGLNLASFDF
jgi:hypothetical protein